MTDWQRTQNEEYLKLLSRRLNEPRLLWVDQFVEIINRFAKDFRLRSGISINDFGCNVGHFYRAIEAIEAIVSYRGYDISETYLKIAKKNFSEAIFLNWDISSSQLPEPADIGIMSATLEHIDDHQKAIKNLFDSSRELVILRTFVGKKYICENCLTEGANEKYLIKQFTLDDLTLYAIETGWNWDLFDDNATNGDPKFVCNAITVLRRQKIIVFKKLKK